MKITSARFVKSALNPDDFPKGGYPEVVFAGRSNVGKSSLLNTLMGQRGLAKTSKTPGKTRTINFFAVNERFYFVDLPGYGFAKVPKGMKAAWGRMLTGYLNHRDPLRLAIHLIDARHPPTRNDFELLDLLTQAQRPTLLVATKWDKLKQRERATSVRTIRKAFELEEDALVLPVSSETGEGIKDLRGVIADVLEEPD